MEENYYSAFSRFLRTGNANTMMPYLEKGANESLLIIYRNGFYKACIDALSANYPVTKILLTEPIFNALAKRYVDQYPPLSGTLVGYGEQFIDFLSDENLMGSADSPTLTTEVSAIDKCWLQCLNSPKELNVFSAEMVTAMAEQETDPGELKLRLNYSIQLLDLTYNSFSLWQSIKSQRSRPKQIDIVDEPSTLMLWRYNGQVYGKIITQAEQFFFKSLVNLSCTLNSLLEETAERFPEFDLGEHVTQCLTNQLLSLVEPDTFSAQKMMENI